jgi:hypothetical protein
VQQAVCSTKKLDFEPALIDTYKLASQAGIQIAPKTTKLHTGFPNRFNTNESSPVA